MAGDPKDTLREAVRVAQRNFEIQTEASRRARRDAFASAQTKGLSLREIGEAVSLHRSRVGQIIEGK